MKIYVSHSRNFDYQKELYEPLRNLKIADLIFPHEKTDKSFDSKSLFQNHECDVVLAEVSKPSTGQGIELGWANILGIKIVCVYKADSKIANSLKVICSDFIEYENEKDLTDRLNKKLIHNS